MIETKMAAAWCPMCGDVEVDASRKCPRCGKLAVPEPNGLGNGSAAAKESIPPPPNPLPGLASDKRVQRWREQTAELIDYLQGEYGQASSQLGLLKKRAEHLGQAVVLLRQIVGPVQSPAEQSKPGRKPASRWSKQYERCRSCGRTEVRHLAKGYCTSCYGKERAEQQDESTV